LVRSNTCWAGASPSPGVIFSMKSEPVLKLLSCSVLPGRTTQAIDRCCAKRPCRVRPKTLVQAVVLSNSLVPYSPNGSSISSRFRCAPSSKLFEDWTASSTDSMAAPALMPSCHAGLRSQASLYAKARSDVRRVCCRASKSRAACRTSFSRLAGHCPSV